MPPLQPWIAAQFCAVDGSLTANVVARRHFLLLMAVQC